MIAKKNSFKVVLLGDSTTGKSTICFRMMYNKFDENTHSTIGAAFFSKRIEDDKYDFWDTAGQERFSSLTPIYYRNADIIMMVFDVNKMITLNKIKTLLTTLYDDHSSDNKPFKILIIGNKIDLVDDDKLENIKTLVMSELQEYLEIRNNISIIFISTKTGCNFSNICTTLTEISGDLTNKNKELYFSDLNKIDLTAKPNNSSYCYC
jgi:Ras-related protein Rab-5C